MTISIQSNCKLTQGFRNKFLTYVYQLIDKN